VRTNGGGEGGGSSLQRRGCDYKGPSVYECCSRPTALYTVQSVFVIAVHCGTAVKNVGQK